MLILTDDDIREDIREFEKRIQDARDKLATLPETATTLKARKKLKEKRYILTSEIEHVKRLVSIAEEALTEV
jgi:predicted  nucleic acid-binding Zn-ribbon protein